MPTLRSFAVFFLLVTLPNGLSAQVIQAGPWTGYPDGIGLGMHVRDSFMYFFTQNGAGFLNTLTKEHHFFNESLSVAIQGFAGVDNQGNMLGIVDHQLAKVGPSGAVEFIGPEPPNYSYVTALVTDHNGQCWAGYNTFNPNNTLSSPLAKLTTLGWTPVDMGQAHANIQDITFDGQNRPVISVYANGIYRYDGSSFVHLPGSADGDYVAASNDGQIASCGTFYSSGMPVYYYYNGFWKNLTSALDTRFDYLRFDAANTLWVCSHWGNIYKMVNDTLQLVLNAPVNYRTGTTDYYNFPAFGFDGAGQLWLGEYDGLFVAADPAVDHWEFVPTAPLLHPGIPTALAAYQDTAWIGNGSGVTRLYDHTFEKITTIGQSANALCYDHFRHGLWVGDYEKIGFYRGTYHLLFDIQPLLPYATSNTTIHAITGDSKGNIWVQTGQTLLRYSPAGEWFSFDCGQELPLSDIISFQVKDSTVWVGVWGNGISQARLFKLEGNAAIPSGFPPEALQYGNRIQVISDTEFWFSGNGVGHYKDGQIQLYTAADLGAPYLNNYWVAPYNDSTVFVYGNSGFYVYRNGQWYYPNIPSVLLHNTDAVAWCLTDDKLYFGGPNYATLLGIENIPAFLEELDGLTALAPDPEIAQMIYPNPVQELLYLQDGLNTSCRDCSARLFNAQGRLLKTINAPLPAAIDLSALASGLYVLCLQSPSEKRVKTIKVIKN